MGMACDVEAVAGTGGTGRAPTAAREGGAVRAEGRGKAESGVLNPEETAMILTSLSRCQFGGPAVGSKRGGSSSGGSSDGERHSDLEGSSDEEEAGQRTPNGHHGLNGSHSSNGSGGRVQRVQQINFDGPVGSKLDFTDEAGFSHRFRNESNRVKSMVTKHISIDELRAHFDRPIIDVARDFGICITLMKKICRRNGIKRWPHRQIRSLSKSIASMEAAMLSAHGGERDKYRDQIHNLKLKRESVIADPNKDSGPVFGGGGGLSPLAPSSSAAPAPSTPQQAQFLYPLHHQLTTGAASLRPHHHASSAAAPKLPLRPSGSSSAASVTIKTEAVAGMSSSSSPPSSLSTASAVASTASTTPTGGHAKGGRWTTEEHAAFLEGIRLYGKDWRRVAQVVVTRSAVQTRTHAQKYLLKFAGRFPFETPEGGGAVGPATTQARRPARSPPTAKAEDVAMRSPAAMTTPASDDSSSTASWASDEPSTLQQPPLPAINPARSEAMALILNGSPALGPEATPEPSALGLSGRVVPGSAQALALPPRSFAGPSAGPAAAFGP